MTADAQDPPLPQLPPRAADSHKNDFGRALIIGGSRGMTGAVVLAGMSALRGGAGLVQLATAASCQDVVASFEPSYMTAGLPEDANGHIASDARRDLERLAENATAIGIGPGLGQSEGLKELVGWAYTSFAQPLIVDADALNALAAQPEKLRSSGGPRIFTPHPGEFRRLIGDESRMSRDKLEEQARVLAKDWGVVIVLKGHRTLVTDGTRSTHNTTGNPGMATGGTGDVLTGLITALVCQKLEPLDAARLGVHLHGLAGDLAAEELGQPSLIASDLILFLPAAFLQHAEMG